MTRHDARIDRLQPLWSTVVLVALMLALAGMSGRIVYINMVEGPRLTALARRQQEGSSVIPARRGLVLDRRGRIVAATLQRPDVFIDPLRAEDVGTLVGELSARLNLAPEAIYEAMARQPQSRYVVLAQQVDEVTAEAVRALGSPAVGLTDGAVRNYPLGASMAHVVGLVGREGRGLEGIELAYDRHLAGTDGKRSTVRDARRRALWRAESGGRLPVDGGHVVLTIDAEIQRITEAALEEGVTEFEAESGIAIVMSPSDGEILAMANFPAFDPNSGVPEQRGLRRNRALTDPVEPGSTIKSFVVCAALDGGFITPTEKFDCHMGRRRIGRRVIRDEHPYGLMDVAGIVRKSSNIGMTLIGERIPRPALNEGLRRFGFGEKTGIECPGEHPGGLTPMHRWSQMTQHSVSFGYEISMTPLQLITGFCAIINDGVLIKPRMVKSLVAPDGSVTSFDGPEIVRRAVSSATARYVVDELLVGVVEQGTGHQARLEQWKVLGKTGTAKLTEPGVRGYVPGAYLSTFIAAAPALAPKVAVMVMVRKPRARLGYYGGTVAAPTVRRIIAESLAYLQVPPDEVVVAGLSESPGDGASSEDQ